MDRAKTKVVAVDFVAGWFLLQWVEIGGKFEDKEYLVCVCSKCTWSAVGVSPMR